MENRNLHIIHSLNHLISISEDGKQWYENAANFAIETSMQNTFCKYALQKSFYKAQLQKQLVELGGTAEKTWHPFSSLQLAWIDFKSVFISTDTKAIIKASIAREETAVKFYKIELQNEFITDYLHAVLEAQLPGIEWIIAEIKSKYFTNNTEQVFYNRTIFS